MRYPRNVKIFRGGVDAAPFAGLFFVLVLFVMLLGWHVFIPGVRVTLSDEPRPPEITSRTVRVLASGEIYFLGRTYDLDGLKLALREGAQKGTLPSRVILESDPASGPGQVEEVENLLRGTGIDLKYPGSRRDLPPDAGFAGSPRPIVVVGMNLNGQIFFQHQRVSENLLEEKLTLAVEKAGEPLTLVLQADGKVTLEKITRLSEIARRAGIAELVLATKPRGT